MHDSDLIWRFGAWIARRESGAARLSWSQGELVLRIRQGRIQSAEGVDSTQISARLGCQGCGHRDVLGEARAIAVQRGVPETQAMGTAKEVLQDALRGWLKDPERELEIVEGQPDEAEGPTISITHALVELVLSDPGSVARAVLPDRQLLLRRTGRFLDLYAPLRLSEEADLIVAKITGQRTVDEIASSSEHDPGEVERLLAALVATGMLEPAPMRRPVIAPDLAMETAEEVTETPTRRALPVKWIGVGVAVVAIALAIAALWLTREAPATPADADSTLSWGLVVDLGCEPEELQRVLRKARQHPSDLRPVATNPEAGEKCWRLVWGRFESQTAAEAAIPRIPQSFTEPGFKPHAVELSGIDGGGNGGPNGG